jgi:hypothetical protein
MLIVGFGLMAAAVTVFLGWNAYMKLRALWRARKAEQRARLRDQKNESESESERETEDA